MPVTRGEFEEMQRPTQERVLEFLAKQADQAFDIFDIIGALERWDKPALFLAVEQLGGGPSETFDRYSSALDQLARQGKIVTGQARGATYYAVKRPR